MTYEQAAIQYLAAIETLKSLGAIGCYLDKASVHIYGEKNWNAIPGEETVEVVTYDDNSSEERKTKNVNGVMFFTLVNKKAAPITEADNKIHLVNSLAEVAATCNGREECFEKCVATEDFTCCITCEAVATCPTNCMEEI